MTPARLIDGSLFVDDRGELAFCNGWDMSGVKRFYAVSNHEPRFIRAWHGHRRETKWVWVASGAALVCAVFVADWSAPDPAAPVQRFALSAARPAILEIPAGHANGFMTLRPDTRVVFFSDRTLAESKDDDIRIDAFHWNPWNVEPR